jgi:hypothetical protein
MNFAANRYAYAGVFFVALATMMHEILLTRIFSVTMMYHFAFVAISVAMFGMTAGALLVYLRPAWFPPAEAPRQIVRWSIVFPLALVLSFLTELSIPFRIHPSVIGVYAVVLTYVVIAVPFVVSGVVICLALTRFPGTVARMYAADLAGAAAACVLLVYTLRFTDGPTAVFVVATLAALGAWCFTHAAGERRFRTAAVVIALGLGAFAAAHTVLVWRQFAVLRILYIRGSFEGRPLYEKWNSYSRVRVNGDPSVATPPYGWGLSETYPDDRLVHQLQMDIDISAGTVMTKYDGDLSQLEHLKYDVTNIGYTIRPGADVLVVGAGGGRDVLSALVFGARSVDAVEINHDILGIVNGRFGDFTGHLDRDPRVRFVNDEARSYIARQDRRYDVLQISLIDTWAATAAGAFVLSENSLYTKEAWRVFQSRLSENGILSVSRWYFRDGPAEMYRLTALASAALSEAGVARPRDHLVIIRNMRIARKPDTPDGVGTLLLGKRPFTPDELRRLDEASRAMGFEIVLSPATALDDTFARLTNGGDISAIVRDYPVNIAPPTDDSPFFFNQLRLRDLFDLDLQEHGKQTHNMKAVFVLGVLLGTVVFLTAICILLPLALTTRKADLAGAGPLLAFFAAIGLGFMLVEISQMQRLIVVLGHPTYGLTVVLFSVLLSSGLGSYLTGRLDITSGRRGAWATLAGLIAVLIAFGASTPWVASVTEGATTPVRIAVAVALLFPPGMLMGTAFPLGMRLAATKAPALGPWLWGVNGATSVLSSVLAMVIALSSSISTAFWAGVVCYGAALLAYRRASE